MNRINLQPHPGHPIQPNPTPLPAVNDPAQISTTVGWAPLPPNWPHAPSVPQEETDLSNDRPDDDGWTDDGWIDDGFIVDGVQPIGETGITTAKPNTTLVEFYPGITIASMNPTKFACSRDGFYFGPHPISCQKYFICSDRQLHEHQCGNGIQWLDIFFGKNE